MGRQRLTWPRTELRGQVTHRPLRRLRFHRAPEMPEPGGNPGLMAGPVVRGPQPNKRENARRSRETVVTEGNRRTWGSGGRPPGMIAAHAEGGRRPPTNMSRLVGEEGFEPSRPCGHTDLNRARLPFRHPPGQRVRLARPHPGPHRRYHRMRAGEGGTRWECCSASSDGSKAW